MQEQQSAGERSMLVGALLGAASFGAGGAAGGILWLFGEDTAINLLPLGMAVMGAVGGAFLGITSRSGKKGLLALASGLGFMFGSWPVLLAAATALTEPSWFAAKLIPAVVALLLFGGVQGVVGTAATFIVLKPSRGAGWLLGAGALGFGIGAQATLATAIGLPGGAVLPVWGAVGGAVLGAALGRHQAPHVNQAGHAKVAK